MEKSFSKPLLVSFLLLSLSLLSWAAPVKRGATPMEVVKISNQQVTDHLKGSSQKMDPAVEKKVFAIIDEVTDFDLLADRVVTTFCPKLKPTQCKEFKQVFIELIRTSSVKKLGRYRADKFEYLGEEPLQEGVVVKTLAYYKADKVELNYTLERRAPGAPWKIANYVIDGVDTVRNYKKQFTRLLAQESFEKMIERLKRKIEEYKADR